MTATGNTFALNVIRKRQRGRREKKTMKQFEKAIKEKITCDICGSIMYPIYGGEWDYDRMVCSKKEKITCDICGSIMYPTSTDITKKQEWITY